jgi:hypothetical protein
MRKRHISAHLEAWLLGASLILTFANVANSQVVTERVDVPVVGEKCNERVKQVTHATAQLQLPKVDSAPWSSFTVTQVSSVSATFTPKP